MADREKEEAKIVHVTQHHLPTPEEFERIKERMRTEEPMIGLEFTAEGVFPIPLEGARKAFGDIDTGEKE